MVEKGLYKDIVEFKHTMDAELIREERNAEIVKSNYERDRARFSEKQSHELVHETRAKFTEL